MQSTPLQLVVGLGNPGAEYALTRHNLGFLALDAYLADSIHAAAAAARRKSKKLLESFDDQAWRSKFSSLYFDAQTEPLQAAGLNWQLPVRHWLKPQSFMNRSGPPIAGCMKASGIEPAQILVVHDELDLPAGVVKVKFGGGSGGHNGLRSIMDTLGTGDFWRLRLGIGKPGPDFKGDGADYVLAQMPQKELEEATRIASQALHDFLSHSPDRGMQLVNTAAKS